jgi:hypothetical protein
MLFKFMADTISIHSNYGFNYTSILIGVFVDYQLIFLNPLLQKFQQ